MNKTNKITMRIAAMLAAVMMTAGCGAPAQTASPSATTPAQQEQTNNAVTKETLIIGTSAKIEKAGRDEYNFDVISGTLSQMAPVKISENGEFLPMATDYKTEDAQTWIFTIKEGLKWHDGVPVTAHDFKFTLEYMDREEPGQFLGQYESVNIIDERTLEIVLKTPNIRALADLPSLRFMPKHIYENVAKLADATEEQATMGCGAYKFVSFDRAAGILEFVANRDFGDGSQTMEKILIKLYGNADTMYMALKTGEIDMVYTYANGIDPIAAQDLAKSDKITLSAIKDTGNTAVLVFNNNKAPWNNLDIRKAVYNAIDYDKFRELFGSEYSSPATAGFLPIGSLGYIETAVNTRNVDESKRILAAAGAMDTDGDGIVEYQGKPLSIELLLRNDKPIYQRYGELLQANLKEAGIGVTLKLTEVSQFRSISQQEHTNDAMITKFTASGMSSGAGLGSLYMDGRLTMNGHGQVTDKAYTDIIDTLYSADTNEKYLAATEECQRYYASTVPAISLYWDSYIQAYSSSLSGFVVNGMFGILNMDTWFSLKSK